MNRIIGIPSDGPETSDNISSHFGHCNYFIGIEIHNNVIFKKVFAIPNRDHTGCKEPVINMKQRNVTDMILSGIGMRPFMGFQQVNINLYQGVNGTIEKNIGFFLQGQLKPLIDATCGYDSRNTHIP